MFLQLFFTITWVRLTNIFFFFSVAAFENISELKQQMVTTPPFPTKNQQHTNHTELNQTHPYWTPKKKKNLQKNTRFQNIITQKLFLLPPSVSTYKMVGD